MRNRLPLPFIVPPSAGDKLIRSAYGAKIELLRFTDEDGNCESSIAYELSGSITGPEARELLATLVREFNSPAGESEASNA